AELKVGATSRDQPRPCIRLFLSGRRHPRGHVRSDLLADGAEEAVFTREVMVERAAGDRRAVTHILHRHAGVPAGGKHFTGYRDQPGLGLLAVSWRCAAWGPGHGGRAMSTRDLLDLPTYCM